MKLIALTLLAVSGLMAQTVTIQIKVGDGPIVEATVSPESVAAMQAFIADQKKDDGTPKYSGIGDLMITHFRDSLAVVLVQKYSASVKAAMDAARQAQVDAEAAAKTASAGTVVLK